MLEKIYKRNIELDQIFYKKYGNGKDIFDKNCIEILVELGEFINETKCFKYWSIKKPNKEAMLDEYADVITMTLYFANLLKMDVKDFRVVSTEKELLDLINETYLLCTKIMNNMTEELIKNILTNVLEIAYLLDISEEEIIGAVNKKHEIIYERLNSDY